MIDNKSYIFKGAALVVCGLLIGFVPNIITNLFYIVGMVILFFNILRFITAMKNSTLDRELANCIFGALAGFAVMALPRFVKVQVPLIVGVIFVIVGISRLLRTLRSDYGGNKLMSIIGAIVLALVGCFFMINPLKISTAVRVIFGLAVAGLGVFNLVMALRVKQHNDNVEPGVVDVDSYSVSDDN